LRATIPIRFSTPSTEPIPMEIAVPGPGRCMNELLRSISRTVRICQPDCRSLRHRCLFQPAMRRPPGISTPSSSFLCDDKPATAREPCVCAAWPSSTSTSNPKVRARSVLRYDNVGILNKVSLRCQPLSAWPTISRKTFATWAESLVPAPIPTLSIVIGGIGPH
jgi:hypothetical protein